MDWLISADEIAYEEALAQMDARVASIREGAAAEAVWLLQHPALYTRGTSAKAADLLRPKFPVHKTGRGGEYTYHGPGQRVAYVMLNLRARQPEPDIKRYVWQLEEWMIRCLAALGVRGERRQGRVGIWVVMPSGADKGQEKKVAALGVRVRHWISFHGVAINVNPELSHFDGIVPCGLSEYGVTSIHEVLQHGNVSVQDVDEALKATWSGVFG